MTPQHAAHNAADTIADTLRIDRKTLTERADTCGNEFAVMIEHVSGNCFCFDVDDQGRAIRGVFSVLNSVEEYDNDNDLQCDSRSFDAACRFFGKVCLTGWT